jgi:cytochrome c oxidase subunit III
MDNFKPYYIPEPSKWPLIAAVGLGTSAIGAATCFHGATYGPYILTIGIFVIIYMMAGWFGAVIREDQAGEYSAQIDRSFRWGMFWFIFSEIMFFAGFFGALFYARNYSVPWLGGDGAFTKLGTHQFLWPNFVAEWPLLINPDPNKFPEPNSAMPVLWIPVINTFLLLSSSVTITVAHHALIANKRRLLNISLAATIILGVLFLAIQAYEYHHAYTDLNLKLTSGIYGTTFFVLTGFHGAHVTIGTIMLITMLARCVCGHFTPQNHFGFQATAWYWHFVDVVWLCLFIYVYILPIK